MAKSIQAFDWAATPLGPIEAWPASLRHIVDFVLASPGLASVAVGPQRILIYNDVAATHYGANHPRALGRPLAETFDEYPMVAGFYDRAFAGESVHVPAQPLDPSGDHRGEVYEAFLTPIHDETGVVVAVHMSGIAHSGQARAEAALRESEARYRSIFASMADGFYLAEAIFDAEGTCVDLRYHDENAAAMRMTGQSFKGRLLSELGGYEPYWYEIFGDTAKTGTPHDAELFAAPDGIWYSFHTFKPPGARENEFVVVFSDVSAQHELAESEAMRRVALSSGRMGSWRWDRAADLIRGDAQFMALWGMPPSDEPLPLATFAARMTLAGAAEMVEIVAKAVAAGEEFSGPLEIVEGPTAGHWVQWQGRAAADDPAVLYGVTYDITEQKAAETRLRESEERYRMLFETMDEGFVVNELVRDDAGNPIDLRYLELNPAVERLVGWKAKETVGRLMSEMITPEETERWVVDFAAVIASGRSSQTEHNHDSLGMWFRANATPIGGDRIALVYQNVTDQKRSEAILRESEERQAFLLRLSDAVRPLAAPDDIQGIATCLLREHLSAGWCYYVEWDLDRHIGLVLRDSAGDGLPSLTGAHDVSDAIEFLDLLTNGGMLTVSDYANYEHLPTRIRQIFVSLGFRSLMAAPLIKGGRLIATLIVGDTKVRRWSAKEVSLLAETAERTWTAIERERAEAALRESETRLAQLADAAPVLIWETSEEGAIFVNSHYLSYFGVSFEDISGFRWEQYIHPDDLDGYVAAYRQAFANRRAYDYECQLLRADGEYRWHRTSGKPSSNGRFIGYCADIHALVMAEQALRQREEQQRLTIKLVPALLWSASPGGQEVTLAEGWTTYTGQNEAETQHHGWLDAVHPDDLPATRAAFEHAFATGEPLERQQRIRKAGDGWRWHLIRQVPVRDEHGSITRWFGAAVDLHDSKLAEQALHETEQRLQTLVEGVPQLVWRASEPGIWTWASPQWTDYTGQAEPDSHGWGWLAPVHPDDREQVRERWNDARKIGRFEADYRIFHVEEQRYRWFQTRAMPVHDADGAVTEWLGTSTDVDDLLGMRDRQQVLVAELQHRVRNILTIVRSVFQRTVEADGPLDAMIEHFRGRLDNLARTQVIVTQSAGGQVDLRDLIVEELMGVGVAEGTNIVIDGPDVAMNSQTGETISLAIHELTTNAVKYGALKIEGATLTVKWLVKLVYGEERRLDLTWIEQGVPAVPLHPARHGFGSELIEEAIPYQLGGETTLEFRGGGVRCTISVPLPDAPASDAWEDQ